MKIKLLVKLGELVLGKAFSDEEPRADMYMPIWLLAFAMVLMVGGIGLGIYLLVHFMVVIAVVAGVCLLLGIAALLCWKNQTIQMLPNDSFAYTTFLGNKTVYRFSEIKGLRKNSDSMTLLVGNGKVHIESCAVINGKLADRINQQLEALYSDAHNVTG